MVLKRLIYIIIGIATYSSSAAQSAKGVICCEPADSLTVSRLLDGVRRMPATTNLPLHFARQFLGVPYVAHTLEMNQREQLVVNTRQMDCTTLVENVVALTLAARHHRYSFRAFVDALQALRYRDGRMEGYASRLHYFTDWIADNQRRGLVTERQSEQPPFTAVQTIDVCYMSQHPKAYKALRENPSLVPVIRRQEQRLTGRKYRYIPKGAVRNTEALRQAVRNGDIIAITCKKAGLDIAHLGFAVWHKDGLHLLNASQLHKKVVEEPMTLGEYLSKHPSHTGIRVISINN